MVKDLAQEPSSGSFTMLGSELLPIRNLLS